ncbi:MAG: GNAT family N-acetyltransferase [Anaerolineae bacterium]|nr:GNAT family N-acetyltransferase [Anaerolineae bacterium]
MTRIDIVPENSLPATLLSEIFDRYHQVFVRESATAEHWIEHPEHRLLVYDDSGQWLCTLEIHQRTIRVGGVEIQVGGIGGVLTLPAYRGQGYAERAMRRAVLFIRDELHLPFGILFCFPALADYYERLGWQRVTADPVYRDRSGAMRTFTDDMGTMFFETGSAGFPPGLVDLNGHPW